MAGISAKSEVLYWIEQQDLEKAIAASEREAEIAFIKGVERREIEVGRREEELLRREEELRRQEEEQRIREISLAVREDEANKILRKREEILARLKMEKEDEKLARLLNEENQKRANSWVRWRKENGVPLIYRR